MFKSRITTLVMLASVVCYSVMFVSEYTQGRGSVWVYPTVLSIVGLVVVLRARRAKKKERTEEKVT
jgi:cytochrome c-type biogenesis protein CcmH/NrfF